MINLLPPDVQSQLRAARANRLLLRYNFLLVAALAFLGVALGLVYIYMMNTKSSAEKAIEYNQSRLGEYATIQSEADLFRSNLTTAKQILDNEVSYSKVVLAIAGSLPTGVVLDTLSLDSSTFGTPTTLAARTKDYPSALALKTSLQTSEIFSDVSIQSISGAGDSQYPLSVVLNVTIRKEAAK